MSLGSDVTEYIFAPGLLKLPEGSIIFWMPYVVHRK